jgi:predicted O-methyltransferase YrrM
MNKELPSDIATVSEFVQLAERFSEIEGWLSLVEGFLLYRLARDGEGHGAIVEIGSWMGRSTAWLAAGSKAAGRERVHAVDVFDGGPNLKNLDVIRKEGTTYNRFAENLERLGLFDHVEPVVAESSTAARDWTKGAIRLLFIDGDHSYPGVKQDVALWSPYVVAGGLVVLDDVTDAYPGVRQIYEEMIAEGTHWKLILEVGKTRTLQKCA